MGRACISSRFKNSGHAQRGEVRLELPIVPYRYQRKHGRTHQQKVPGAIESPEHCDR